MEGGKPHHGHQRQSGEAVRAAAGDVVVEELTQALPEQEEVAVVAAAAAGGADHQFDSLVGEAFSHALQLEELADVDVWDLFVPPRAEGPAAGSQPVTHDFFPAGPPVFDDDVAGAAAQANANVHQQVGGAVPHHQQGQDVDMHQEPSDELHTAAADLKIFGFFVNRATQANAANNQLAAPAKNYNYNQHAVAGPAAASGAGQRRPSPSVPPQPQERGTGGVLSSAYTPRVVASSQSTLRRRHRWQQPEPVGGGEAITTLRSETRAAGAQATSWTAPGKADIISVRQAMLADAAQSPVFLAGIEEEEHGNSWYDSIVREAQAMDEPAPFFEHQFPRFDEEPSRVEPAGYSSPPKRLRDHVHLSDLGLDDAAGPSSSTQTTRRRVLPLADDEVPKFDCGICMETLPILDLFHGMQCLHRFCVKCMATYIEGRINGGEVPIPCPDPACPEAYGADIAVLHPEVCKKSIDFAAFSSWGDRLTERAIPPNLRAYCPNRQCGVLLEATGGKTPAKAFCPVCSHPMCATCGFGWSHDDADGGSQHNCDEGPNVELVKKLAQDRRWKQCPRCKMLVEKTYGCNFMQCRCKFVFCYGCGLPKRQPTGMEQGTELCKCEQADPVDAVPQDFDFFY